MKLFVNQGSLSKLLLEEMSLNIGNVILTCLPGDKRIKLNCMAADLSMTRGMNQTRSFIIGTDDVIITVSGTINLAH